MTTEKENAAFPVLRFLSFPKPDDILIIRIDGTISAGFPSPADDFLQHQIDLRDVLMPNPDASFVMQVSGDSMQDASIDDGDVLVIDRSVRPVNGCIAVCQLNGEFTVKRLLIRGKAISLLPANPAFPQIDLQEGDELTVWGVVTYVIKKTV